MHPEAIGVSAESAVHGEHGLYINYKRNAHDMLECQTVLIKESWHRFSIRVDSCEYLASPERRNLALKLSFIDYAFSEKIEREQNDALVAFFLEYRVDQKQLNLVCASHTPDRQNTERPAKLAVPLKIKRNYCVETRIVFNQKDSAFIELFLDGFQIGSIRVGYYAPLQFIRLRLNSGYSADYLSMEKLRAGISLDDFELSDSRPYGVPPDTKADTVFFDTLSRLHLACDSFITSYQGERQQATHWRVCKEGDSQFSVFDAIERSPACFNTIRLPFQLDEGKYFWQARFKNNHDAWGEWGKADSFSVPGRSNVRVEIKDVYFTQEKKNSPIFKLKPDEWYDLHLRIYSKLSWDSLYYVLIQLHDTAYLFGHPANKGGIFLPNSNYVLNLSVSRQNKVLFEKITENSIFSQPASKEKEGLYLDGRPNSITVDTATGYIKMRFRLLAAANEGTWRLCAHLVYPDHFNPLGTVVEAYTNRLMKTFIVSKSQTKKNSGWITLLSALVLISAVAVGLWIVQTRRRSRATPAANSLDPDYSRIVEYIQNNLGSDIRVESTLSALRMSEKHFYNILKQNHIEFRKLVVAMRMKKARQLLEETDMNISMVASAVGFQNLPYFTQTFKKQESLLPSEVKRKKLG